MRPAAVLTDLKCWSHSKHFWEHVILHHRTPKTASHQVKTISKKNAYWFPHFHLQDSGQCLLNMDETNDTGKLKPYNVPPVGNRWGSHARKKLFACTILSGSIPVCSHQTVRGRVFFALNIHPLRPLRPVSSLTTGQCFALQQSAQRCLITGLSGSHREGLEGLRCVIKQASVPPEGHRSRCSH